LTVHDWKLGEVRNAQMAYLPMVEKEGLIVFSALIKVDFATKTNLAKLFET
jgi:hypothetical protein